MLLCVVVFIVMFGTLRNSTRGENKFHSLFSFPSPGFLTENPLFDYRVVALLLVVIFLGLSLSSDYKESKQLKTVKGPPSQSSIHSCPRKKSSFHLMPLL